MDRKADKAQEHAEQLRRDREVIVDKISGYHRHIDGCTAEMSEYTYIENNQQLLVSYRGL